MINPSQASIVGGFFAIIAMVKAVVQTHGSISVLRIVALIAAAVISSVIGISMVKAVVQIHGSISILRIIVALIAAALISAQLLNLPEQQLKSWQVGTVDRLRCDGGPLIFIPLSQNLSYRSKGVPAVLHHPYCDQCWRARTA